MTEFELENENKQTPENCVALSSRELFLDFCSSATKTMEARLTLAAAEQKKDSSEKVINISEADKVFGWWQQDQYEKIGVEQIRIGPGKAGLDLKAPYHKDALVTELDMDKRFSFNFEKDDRGNWTMSNIKGLKVDGVAYDHATASDKGIKFWNSKQEREFGKRASGFIRALLEPLMRDDLRK